MTFSASGFHRLPHVGNGISQYFYKTTGDTLKTVASATATTYFAYPSGSTGNINALSTDDLIYVEASDAHGMFKVASIASSTSSPFSTAVTLAQVTQIVGAQTGISSATNLAPYGLIVSTATSTSTYTLDSPWTAGQMVTFSRNVGTTAVHTLVGASTVAGFFGSTGLQIVFSTANQAVTLMAKSTAGWEIVGRAQSATEILGPVMS